MLYLDGCIAVNRALGAGRFGAHLTIAVVFGNNQAIWGALTPVELRGWVFAAQQMVTRAVAPLAERIFEPLLVQDGPLADTVGNLLGARQGCGIGLIFVIMGVIKFGF